MTNDQLITYLDHVSASLTSDYETVFHETRALLDNPKLSKMGKAALQWGLTRLHTDMLQLHQSIKDQQRFLKDANGATSRLRDE